MNKQAFLILLFPLILSCTSPQSKEAIRTTEIVVQQSDKAILEQLFQLFAHVGDGRWIRKAGGKPSRNGLHHFCRKLFGYFKNDKKQ